MHILLVNDDGIGAIGIMALMDAAAKRGHHVSMCAPSGQQSAASQRITLSDPLYVKDYPVEVDNARAFAITGTPADCVRLALLGGLVTQPVDVLISGINNGYNAGMATYYSGTVGAAREGALNGLKAIAASIDYHADPAYVRELAEYVIAVAEGYANAQPASHTILNLNAPSLPVKAWKGAVYAPLSRANFLDGYDRREASRVGTYFWLEAGSRTEEPEEGSDAWYLERGYATFTLVGVPWCEPRDVWTAMKIAD